MQATQMYCIVVIVDTHFDDNIVGSMTLLIEMKFTHGCGRVGHIEDVVVDKACRGKGFGKLLIDTGVEIARAQQCYKVILDASEANAPFYEKCGFKRKELQMRCDLE